MAVGGVDAPSAAGRDAGMRGPGTYANEREVAFRVDSDSHWEEESGADAGAVVGVVGACNALYTVAFAGAGERGCLTRPEVNLPDAVGPKVLRCIGRGGQA